MYNLCSKKCIFVNLVCLTVHRLNDGMNISKQFTVQNRISNLTETKKNLFGRIK